jgi:radical SAM protein with 4Fe4S-binding SPASM domain
METQDFEDYARQKTAHCGRIPLSGSMEITWRCNLRCVHCYMRPYRAEPELTTADIRRILDELAGAGCLRLLITGGEPLVRDDFAEIWRYAKSKGFLLTLFTNATLVDDEIAALLHDLPPTLCEITLYGASPETYRRACGNGDAFRAALDGMDRLQSAGLRLNIKSMAFRENADDMDALEALCADRGLDFSFDTDIFPTLDSDPEPFRHAFPPEEGVRRVLSSTLHQKVWREQADQWRSTETSPLSRAGKVVVCRAGGWSFHIGPFGDLCLCMLLREPSFSLREGRFMEGWNTVIRDLVELERSTPLHCLECPDLRYCVPCAGRNLLETGSVESPAPAQCRRSRAVAKHMEECAINTEEVASHAAR